MKKKEAKIEKDKTLSERGLADLDTLMQHAKELSHLAKSTSSRIETKQGSNLDEAAQLRGIMMSLGTEFLLFTINLGSRVKTDKSITFNQYSIFEAN